MNSDHITLFPQRLCTIAAGLLQAGGFTAEDAERMAESLVLSDLSGHPSHGVVRVAEYLVALKRGEVATGVELLILNETAQSCHSDGQRGPGQVQMARLLEKLLTQARENAVVSGTLRHSGHTGRLGEWAEIIAGAGYAGFVCANDNGALQIVAPPGAKRPATSTNPVAFGVPLPDGNTFVFDFATSAAALGKMHLARLAGEACAPGLIQDAEGNPSTDPAVLFQEPTGALLPMGGAQGYKGFGLSMIVDLLAAGLGGGFTPPAPEGTPVLNNALVTIWNPSYFTGFDHFTAQAKKYLAHVSGLPPTDPAQPVRVPGMRAKEERRRREAEGIPVAMATCHTLARSAEITGFAPSAEKFLEELQGE